MYETRNNKVRRQGKFMRGRRLKNMTMTRYDTANTIRWVRWEAGTMVMTKNV